MNENYWRSHASHITANETLIRSSAHLILWLSRYDRLSVTTSCSCWVQFSLSKGTKLLMLYGIILGTLGPHYCVAQPFLCCPGFMSLVELVLALLALLVGLVAYTQFVIRPALRKFA